MSGPKKLVALHSFARMHLLSFGWRVKDSTFITSGGRGSRYSLLLMKAEQVRSHGNHGRAGCSRKASSLVL